MSILTRYVIREMVPPTLLGFGFYTFMIVMRTMFDLAEVIIRRSLPLISVVKLLALSLPYIVVLTIPMSLLLGILIAVGRLSSDSEIIAMRSAGISTARIYRPVLYFSAVVFLITLVLINVAVPLGSTARQEMLADLTLSAVSTEIKPRVFYDEFENLVIYVNDVDPAEGLWNGVFVSDRSEDGTQRVTVADSGRLTTIDEQQVWLDLYDAETHIYDADKPDRYQLTRNAEQRLLLVDRTAASTAERSRSYRELTLPELVEAARAARDPIDQRAVAVEIHKKFSIPFACLAFGLVGLPLGITNRRGGKSSGFTLSIALILLYYIMINTGEDLATSGRLPAAVAMWLPNLVLVALGVYLIFRANADRGTRSGVPLSGWFAGRMARLKARRVEAARNRETRSLISRLDIAFPNILDRYLLKEFLKIFGLVLLSTIVLFIVVDYATEIAGEVAEHGASFSLVASYYRYFIFPILNWALPVTVLLGTLITFGILSKNNEVTAIKASGVSLYRIALPIVAIAAIVSVVAYFMLDFVLPHANERVAQLKDRIKGRETARTFTLEQRQWVFGKGRYLFNFLSYNRVDRTLSQVQVFEFDPVTFDLTRRVRAQEARFDGVGWVFVDGWIRSFEEEGAASFSPIVNPIRLHYPERPEYFAIEAKKPEQMTYAELRRYIHDLRSSGYSAEELTVDLYEKTSWPAISLVMALIALPFSFRIGKRGALYGVGIALFLAFVYWTIFGIFTKFGEVGNLPAILSAWSANILFALAAVYLFLRIET